MATPRIKTTLVGSYPVPDWLAASPSEQALTDAMRVVLATQERAGIDVVCDGELYRFDINHPETNGMIEYFVRPMDGVRREIGFEELIEYRKAGGMQFRARPPGVVDRPLGSGTLDLPSACARQGSWRRTAQVHRHRPAHARQDAAQQTVQGHRVNSLTPPMLAGQVRHVDADVVQIDEANLPGHADEWKWAASAINRVLDAVKGKPAVHLCFGNYGGQSIQKGNWAKLMDYLNALHADHVVMECAHRPAEELAVFRELRPGIGLGLGVVDVKRTEIESAEEIARAIERAQKTLGPGRVTYVHPDCGLWMLRRNMADGKIRALVQGRDLFEGRNPI
jgi:5-methyltetrahydropteroyltriglutamate--homocysteine methyltransferase